MKIKQRLSIILFGISLLISGLVFLLLVFHRELRIDEDDRDLLFIFFLVSLVLSSFGLFDGFNQPKKDTLSWVGIWGNLLLLLPLSFTSFGYIIHMSQKPNLKILNFEDFDFHGSDIENGEQIKILSATSGKQCTTEKTYFHSIIAIRSKSKDTIRVLTPCQILSPNFIYATFKHRNSPADSIMKTLGYGFSENEFVVINKDLHFQNNNYDVAIGPLGFKDDNNQILKEELLRKDLDTNFLDQPKHEIKIDSFLKTR